jgi:hypothetical protein
MSFLKKLPEWFDLDNYQVLINLTPAELKAQIDARIMALGSLYGATLCSKLSPGHADILKTITKEIHNIWLGNVCIAELKDVDIGEWARPVTPTSSMDAVCHYLALEEKGFMDDDFLRFDESTSYFIGNDIYTENRSLEDNELDVYTHGFSVNIDLETSTNKEIIQAIKKSLPKWRKKTGLKEPEREQLINETYKGKVLDYKVLPLIDLIIWQTINDKKFSRKALFSYLYKDYIKEEPITDKKYDEVIKPFVLRCVGSERLKHNPEIYNLFQLTSLEFIPIKK